MAQSSGFGYWNFGTPDISADGEISTMGNGSYWNFGVPIFRYASAGGGGGNIAKINGVAVAGISKINGVAFSSMAKINSITK